MARLFIFAIGGTGSRVLKSLTMLLASGIKPKSEREFEIVPIIIDPHKSNEDLKRTERLLCNYQKIFNKTGSDSGFFNTKILALDNAEPEKFTFALQEVADKKFKDYIGFNQLNAPSQALADILFSGQSINKHGDKVDLLDIEMDIGFVGNPNLGSVVLNQFKDSKEFKMVASNFNEEDRIFIISSIFGGTGAAGFPTILKNIREAMNNLEIDNRFRLQNAKIGALTVLPYFNIENDPDSSIHKSDFIGKTKAALSYYKDNVAGNNSLNALYYIADDFNGSPYKNDPGHGGQKNDAHFVELASALAIIDFLEISDMELKCSKGTAESPIYKEFGIEKDTGAITFSDLGENTERKIILRLSQLALFRKFLNEHLLESIGQQAWSKDKPHQINQDFVGGIFYKTYISEFLSSFGEWLKEMSENRRGFSPFNLDSDLAELVKGKTGKKKGLFSCKKVDYAMYDSELSKKSRGRYRSSEQKFVKLFFEVTKEILISKFNIKD